jgi:GTP-binding protein HflX
VARSQRDRQPVKSAAIVGYTNAGKSTLLNTLTQAGVLSEDKLFATLDPTTRSLCLESGQEILLTDTVGFIRKLPHHLIEAFKSTLEEAKYADYIIHVVDASNPQMEKQMHIVYETLESLEACDKKIITLFNKVDCLEQSEADALEGLRDGRADRTLRISAKTGQGMEELRQLLEEILREDKQLLEKVFHYQDAGQIQLVRRYGELLAEEYREEGIYVKAYVPAEIFNKLW